MTSRQTRSKDSSLKQSPKLRPRRIKNVSEKPQQKTSKLKKSYKRKRKCEIEDVVDGPSFFTSGKRSKLLDALPPSPLRWRSKDIMAEKTESIDGGPLNFYPMKRRGPFYIIHNFAGLNEKFKFRKGGAHDVGKLTACFGKLGFHHDQVDDCKTNLTCEEMRAWCEDWAKRDYHSADCVIVVILTHGESPDQLLGVDGKCVALDHLLSPFNRNRTLVGKPKIFFIQACRGDKINIGVRDRNTTAGVSAEQNINATTGVSSPSLQPNNEAGSSTKPEVNNSGYLPRQADHLIAFATGDGYQASRVTESGSWYIDELIKVMYEEYSSKKSKKHIPRHLVDVLTEVQGRVSNLVNKELFNAVQMPEFKSSLRGPIYL